LILTGKLEEDVIFSNITVEGNLDVFGLDTDNYSFEGITVEGDTTI